MKSESEDETKFFSFYVGKLDFERMQRLAYEKTKALGTRIWLADVLRIALHEHLDRQLGQVEDVYVAYRGSPVG